MKKSMLSALLAFGATGVRVPSKDVKNTNFYQVLAQLFADNTSKATDTKCTPDSSCWPSEEQWQAFNSTIDG